MKFTSFLRDKLMQITFIIFALVTIEIFLMAYPFGDFIKVYIPIIILTLYSISIIIEYLIKKKYYNNIEYLLNELEYKYLIAEIIKKPNFMEGKLLVDILEQVNKSMIENVNKYKYLQEDYKEYIEMWIHEIKTPIATSKMIIENNKNNVTKSIDEELEKIDNFIEQVLFYARSNTVEKDYYIKKCSLRDIVNEVIYKNKTALMSENISIDAHNLDIEVRTDNKWIVFMLNQVLQNSIKYRKKDEIEKIEIYSEKYKEYIVLTIKDNGIGIKESEISKVFDKGFTGTNGRLLNKKSTGIGLYLCKKLCDKLGIAIKVSSIEQKGTKVELIFPNNSYIDMN